MFLDILKYLLEDIGAVFNAFSTVDFEHKEPN